MPITPTTIEAETTEVESTPEGSTIVAEETTTMDPSVSAAGVSDGEAAGFSVLVVGLGGSVITLLCVIKRKPRSVNVETKLQKEQPDDEESKVTQN